MYYCNFSLFMLNDEILYVTKAFWCFTDDYDESGKAGTWSVMSRTKLNNTRGFSEYPCRETKP